MIAQPGVEIVYKHFPKLTAQQKKQLDLLAPLYFEWNEKINVISRQDINSIYLKHVLHSLGIAKVRSFPANSQVLDVGTGGGFPGIPLAILYPEVQFHLVDSVAKKIKVVQQVSEALGLKNVISEQIRAEKIRNKFDFIISRAVTKLSNFAPWVAHNLKTDGVMIFLKGGDLKKEVKESKLKIKEYNLSRHFDDPFFESKKVLFLAYPDIKKRFFSR